MTDHAPSSDEEDEPFDLLSNARRLYLLEYLHDRDEPVQLTEAATHIAARENGKSPEELEKEERRRVYISLYQTHLQLLLERGVIDWNESTNDIELVDSSQVESYLDTNEPATRRWDQAHVALAVIGLFAVTLAIPGIYPFSALPITGYVLLVSVATVGLAMYRLSERADGSLLSTLFE